MGPPASGDNDLPSLLRRSHLGPVYDHDVRFEQRNAEDVHKDALAAALVEHERIREAALRAYELNELRQEQERLRLHAVQEEERVRIETERAKEECRLREIENKKKQIPVPAPRAKTPPPRAPSPPVRTAQSPKPAPAAQPAPIAQKPPTQPAIATPKQAAPSNLFQAAAPKLAHFTQPLTQETARPAPPEPAKQSQPAHTSSHTLPHIERYAEIHQTLKKLRAMIVNEGKQNLPFKKKTGEMRRAIRTCMGQLTGEKGSNKQPVSPHIPPYLAHF
jgi:nucleoporin GLE1